MKFLNWLLCTVQFLDPAAYFKIKKEQMHRKKEHEPPFEGTWYFKFVQRPSWHVLHWWRTSHWPKEIILQYGMALKVFMDKAEEFKCDRFRCGKRKARLSGSTLVLDETYTINFGRNQIYVHKKDMLGQWVLVYRTAWLMNDLDFIQPLSFTGRAAVAFQPDIFWENKENPGDAANCADIN